MPRDQIIHPEAMENDSNDPRNARNTLDLQKAMGEMQQYQMMGVKGQMYQHYQTKEAKIGDYRRDRAIYFIDDPRAYDANDWEVCYNK